MISYNHLIEVSLQEELLENTDELLERRELPSVQLHQLHRLQPVGHVEADVHLDLCTLVRQLDYWHRCLVQHLEIISQRRKRCINESFTSEDKIILVSLSTFECFVFCRAKLERMNEKKC